MWKISDLFISLFLKEVQTSGALRPASLDIYKHRQWLCITIAGASVQRNASADIIFFNINIRLEIFIEPSLFYFNLNVLNRAEIDVALPRVPRSNDSIFRFQTPGLHCTAPQGSQFGLVLLRFEKLQYVRVIELPNYSKREQLVYLYDKQNYIIGCHDLNLYTYLYLFLAVNQISISLFKHAIDVSLLINNHPPIGCQTL